MKKMKRAIAVLLATALMAEPLITAGTMDKVYAAEAESDVYEQMKVTDISVSSTMAGFDKDAIAIGDSGVPMNVDVSVAVPDGWAVSEISVGWYAVGDDEYYDFITEKYNVAMNPANGVFSLEHNLDKYISPDTYYLSDVCVSFVNEDDASLYYELYGETTEYYKVASEDEPVEFAWTAYTKKDFFELDNTKYDGSADYTVKSATGNDKSVPLISKVALKSADILYSGDITEIAVTASDKGSGIKTIEVITVTSGDEGFEVFTFEADGVEKYTDSQTFTLTGEEEESSRTSGKYEVYLMYIEDYAGNYMEYYADEDSNKLIGYEDQKNEDGTSDEITHKIKNISYSVCNAHKYVNGVTKATTSANGSTYKECKYCGAIKEGTKVTVYKIKTVKLSQASFIYNGEVRKPTVSVYDSKGNKISSSNYTVTYAKGRKNVGTYNVKVKFKGNYKGTVNKTITIKPKGTSIKSLTAGSKQFKVKWTKQTTQTTGYQICYSTDSNFENAKKKLISKNSYTQSTVKDLKAKKTYYVKIRTYKTVKVNGESKKIYSNWSKVKTVKTK